MYDFWAMYNSEYLLDEEGESTGVKNPNYDPEFVIYLFEEDVAVAYSSDITMSYNAADRAKYKSAVVIYKGFQATVTKNFTVAKEVKEIKLNDEITPSQVHDAENEKIGVSEWKDTKGIQTPALSEGMIPVKWDKTKDEGAGAWVITNASEQTWYNYSAAPAGSLADYNGSYWANVMLSDGTYKNIGGVIKNGSGNPVKTDGSVTVSDSELGSMFVWIPRYEYKITGKNIDVNFISTTTKTGFDGYATVEGTADSTGLITLTSALKVSKGTVYKNKGEKGYYIIHSAFTENINNGGWSSELPGIWVAKFEASNLSCDTTKENGEIPYESLSNVNKNIIRVVPEVTSWRNIQIGNMYTVCRNMTGNSANTYGFEKDNEQEGTGKNYAHLMKNSEWGAVAYLAHSKYGRNGTEIDINTNSSFITGIGGNTTTGITSQSTGNYVYNKRYGVKASTTGNVSGIYDMSGGALECLAAFNGTDSEDKLQKYGSTFAKKSDENISTKYATWYNNKDTSGSIASSKDKKTGDATYETADWNSDNSNCAYSSFPFFIRGGNYGEGSLAGIFDSNGNKGGGANIGCGFRPVLVAPQ